jgi:hypothetical protein
MAASIKAGGSGYFLVNGKPYQRGAYEASYSGGTAGAETHVRIFSIDTSDGIRDILSLTEISTIESDSGTYADAAELKAALEGFFFRNIGGGGGGAVDSVNGQTGSVILNLNNINDVPPYPNDGNDYVLVENNGSLTWEVPGGGGAVTAPNVTFDPAITPFANLQEFSENADAKLKAIVTNEAEFDAALADGNIEYIFCAQRITLTTNKETFFGLSLTISGAPINPTDITFTSRKINLKFENQILLTPSNTFEILSADSSSDIKIKKLDSIIPTTQQTVTILFSSTLSGNFIYENASDLVVITDDGNPTTVVTQGLWFTSPSRPKDLLQDGATDGQVITWNNTTGEWEPQPQVLVTAISAINQGAFGTLVCFPIIPVSGQAYSKIRLTLNISNKADSTNPQALDIYYSTNNSQDTTGDTLFKSIPIDIDAQTAGVPFEVELEESGTLPSGTFYFKADNPGSDFEYKDLTIQVFA